MNRFTLYGILSLIFATNYAFICTMNNNQANLNKQLIDIVLEQNLTEIQKFTLIDKLLKSGADINSKPYGHNDSTRRAMNIKTGTPLIEASRKKQNLLMSFLLSKLDINVNAQNDDGHTALMKATCIFDDTNDTIAKTLNITKSLLSQGARIDITSNKGETVFHFAAISGIIDILDLILQETNKKPLSFLTKLINQQDQLGNTALHKAVSVSSEICKKLLEAGANPNIKNLEGNNALELAELSTTPRISQKEKIAILNLLQNWESFVKKEISVATNLISDLSNIVVKYIVE